MFRTNLMRVAVVATLMVASVSAYAFRAFPTDDWRVDPADQRQNSYYIGMSGSYLESNWGDISDSLKAIGHKEKVEEPSFAGRAYFGCYFSEYFGAEFGFSYLDRAEFKIDEDTVDEFKDVICMSIVDLTLNVRVPLNTNFTLFSKFGLAYMRAKNSISVDKHTGLVDSSDDGNVAITYALGLDYCLSRRFTMGLSWQQFRGNNQLGNFVADINMFAIGFAYIFTPAA